MMVDQNVPGVEALQQESWETLNLQEDATKTAPVLEKIGHNHRKKPQLKNVAALVLLLTAFCVVVTLVAHKALASKVKSAPKYLKIKDEEAQQKLQELVNFMDSCRLSPKNRPRRKTVKLLYAGVQVTIEVVELRHKDDWPPQEVVASARNEVENTVERAVSFLNKHGTGARWQSFAMNSNDSEASGKLTFFIQSYK